MLVLSEIHCADFTKQTIKDKLNYVTTFAFLQFGLFLIIVFSIDKDVSLGKIKYYVLINIFTAYDLKSDSSKQTFLFEMSCIGTLCIL
jgi:hypothetical protein